MLSVIYYDNLSEVEKLDFIQSKQLVTVVTPNPNISDAFRSRFQSLDRHFDVDVITVSKFINDLAQRRDLEINVQRKVELLLELSLVWRIKAPELSYEAFIKTFNTFTDLRSYTLNFELIEQFLTEFDPKEAAMLQLFWLYAEQIEMVDEHKANHLLAQKLRADASSEERTYIFWGFSHLSGTQIDLIETLSSYEDVYLPFPRRVFQQSKSTDWIRWVDKDNTFDLEEITKIPAKLKSFDSNRLNEIIKTTIDSSSKLDILLMQKNPSAKQVGEIPFWDLDFRVTEDIFSPVVSKLFYEFHKYFIQTEILINDAIDWTQEQLLTELKKELELKDFRLIKVLGIFMDNLIHYRDKTDQKETLDSFDLKLLVELVNLGCPRTFASIVNERDPKCKVFGLESIDSLNFDKEVAIVLSKQFMAPALDRIPYSENMADFLKEIAPVRSNELDNKLLQFKIEEVVKHNPKVTFYIENGILEKSAGWIKLLENFEFTEDFVEFDKKNIKQRDLLSQIILQEGGAPKAWSASRLQTYLDCPRKYYFQYIDKIDTPRNLFYEILPNDLGVLEHSIIEKYCQSHKVYNEQSLKELVYSEVDSFLKNNNYKQIRKIDLENYYHEVFLYSSRAIVELMKLYELGDVEIHIEEDKAWKKEDNISGSIDCIVKTPKGYFILDFKRSKNQITTISGFNEFKKIQLWFYKEHLNESLFGDFLGMGYMTLGDLGNSQLFFDSAIKSDLIEIGFLKPANFKKMPEQSLFADYSEYEKELVEKACNDKEFKAWPLESTSCNYCPIENLCPKGELN